MDTNATQPIVRQSPAKDGDNSAESQHEQVGPKFTLVEIILGTLFCILLDIIAAIGDVFSFSILGDIIQWASWLVFTFWFTIKGCTVTSGLVKRYLVPMLISAIPIFPTLTPTFLVTVYLENHPEKFGVLEKIESLAKKLPGKK